jgi:aminoglycoside 6-adenylyltransferase
MFDQAVREQLMKMLTWYVGIKTDFSCSPGKFGKYFRQYLEPQLWDMLQKTYADAGYDNTWEAMETMCALFRLTACQVAEHFGFDYPHGDDQRVSAHLKHVRTLPKNATEMY